MSAVSDEGKGRDEHTWGDCTNDLALATRLTLREAGIVTFALRECDLHPYDALPALRMIFDEDMFQKADGLRRLLSEKGGERE